MPPPQAKFHLDCLYHRHSHFLRDRLTACSKIELQVSEMYTNHVDAGNKATEENVVTSPQRVSLRASIPFLKVIESKRQSGNATLSTDCGLVKCPTCQGWNSKQLDLEDAESICSREMEGLQQCMLKESKLYIQGCGSDTAKGL
jgi:hypothetical protein